MDSPIDSKLPLGRRRWWYNLIAVRTFHTVTPEKKALPALILSLGQFPDNLQIAGQGPNKQNLLRFLLSALDDTGDNRCNCLKSCLYQEIYSLRVGSYREGFVKGFVLNVFNLIFTEIAI